MASNSYGYGGNQSYGYGYGFNDEKVAVKPTAAPAAAPAAKSKGTPKPIPQAVSQSPSGKKRTSHSRYMPVVIILIVLTLGMVFIGLVMTIVAHWPGYSAIGGNPLFIAGPVLLSFGFVGFILCMIIVCAQKNAERISYQKRFNKLASNARIIQAQNRVPSMGSIAMMPDGQAMMMTANTPSAYTDDQSYSHNFDSHASDNSIEKMPLDPDGAGVVPMPVRPSSRKTKKQEALGDAAADDDREYGAEGDDGQRRKHRHRRQDGDGDDDPNKPKRKSKKRADGEGQLRIDIKAQPGTSVHIAPGTNYPPAANATISSETEI